MTRDPIAPRRLIYGTVRVSGTIIFMHTTGTKNEYLHLVIVLAGHECADIGDIYFNDELVELSGATPSGKYSAVARINKHLGTSGEAADSDLVSETGGLWTSAHKVSGCAYLAVRLKWSPDLFPNGLPTISAVVRGKKVYDPRTTTTAWSDNAALCAGDFLMDATWGRGVALARIRDADWQEAANICAETVVMGDPQTKSCDIVSGNRHIGCASVGGILPGYTVSGSGIASGTKVVSIDVSGTFFTVDRDPTATGNPVSLTLGAGETRYTCNGIVTADQQPAEVLRDLAGAMAGHLVDTGGLWTIRAGAWRTPVLTLTDADLSGPVSVSPRQSRQDTFNGVKGVFVSPANQWAPADFPVVKNDTYMADDGGVRLWLDTQYNFTTSPAMAQRLAKIELERGRQQIVMSGQYMLKAMQLMPGDVVGVTRARLGWSAKYFEVVDWQFQQTGSGDAPGLAVALTLRETAEGVWDWADGEETTIDLAPNTTLPDAFTVPTPTGLALVSASVMQSDGTVLPRLSVSWTATTNIYVEQGGSVAIEYKRTADSVWIEWARVRGDLTADMITGLVIGTGYDVRLRFINSTGVRGSYCSTVAATVTGDVSAPGVPSGLAAVVGTGKAVSLSWTAVTDIDLSEYRVYRNTVNTFGSATLIAETGSNRFVDVDVAIGTTYYYWVASVDYSENVSSPSSSVSAAATSGAVIDTTPPNTPSASSFSASGVYEGSDGTVFAYISISVPALPTLATYQNLLYKKTGGGGDWLIAAQLTNTGTQIVKIDDLVPGVAYDIAVMAFSAFSIASALTGCSTSPITAPSKTASAGAFSSTSLASPSSAGLPALLIGGAVAYGAVARFTCPSDADLVAIEIKSVGTNSDAATDYQWFMEGEAGTTYRIAAAPSEKMQCAFYSGTVFAGYCFVRSINASGVASSWTSLGNLNSVIGLTGGGAAALNVGTGAGTVAAGNDSRLLSTGTTAGTQAAGDDSRITGAAQKASNLSDLASAATARSNLGVGTRGTEGSGDAINIGSNVLRCRRIVYDDNPGNQISFYWDGANVRVEVDGSLQGTIPNP